MFECLVPNSLPWEVLKNFRIQASLQEEGQYRNVFGVILGSWTSSGPSHNMILPPWFSAQVQRARNPWPIPTGTHHPRAIFSSQWSLHQALGHGNTKWWAHQVCPSRSCRFTFGFPSNTYCIRQKGNFRLEVWCFVCLFCILFLSSWIWAKFSQFAPWREEAPDGQSSELHCFPNGSKQSAVLTVSDSRGEMFLAQITQYFLHKGKIKTHLPVQTPLKEANLVEVFCSYVWL